MAEVQHIFMTLFLVTLIMGIEVEHDDRCECNHCRQRRLILFV